MFLKEEEKKLFWGQRKKFMRFLKNAKMTENFFIGENFLDFNDAANVLLLDAP